MSRSLFLILLIASAPVHSFFNKESPVLWRETDSPVVRDIVEVHQDVLYLSPCYMVNNATVDPSNVAYLSEWCDQLFETDFLAPIRSFCSARDLATPTSNLSLTRQPVKLNRQKRMPLLLLPLAIPAATLIKTAVLSVVSLIGITFGAYSISKHNDHDEFRAKMQEEMEKKRQDHERLGQLLNMMAADQKRLNERLNLLERRLEGFIEIYPSATTLIADISSRLGHLRSELRTIGDQWKKNVIDPTLFSILDLKLEAHMDVTRAVPLSCEMDEVKRLVSLKFRIPVRDPISTLLKADPFVLYTYPDNDSLACTFEYTGPRYAVFNNHSRCVYPLFGV